MSSSATMRLRVHECACHGGNLERFVRPLLLAHLCRAPEGKHGYALLQELAQANGLTPDPSGLYRALHDMEGEGLVAGRPDESGEGPSRHVYRLTDAGRDCLAVWTRTLRDYAHDVQQVADFCGSAR